MSSPTTRQRKKSLNWRARMTLISKSRRPPTGGLLARCQALDNPSPRVTPSSTDDHVAAVVFPRNPDLISLPNPTNHVPHPRGQRSQLVTRRLATRHGPPITVPLVHVIVLVSPCHLVTRTFNKGEEGLEPFPHFSLLQRPPATGLGREQGQKAVARRALHTTPPQFTSLLTKVTMKRNYVSRLLSLKGLSRKLRERIASGYSRLVPVLEPL